jgi:hypothetical protein
MPFLKNSRYYGLDTFDATDAAGRSVSAVKLRRLPKIDGTPSIVTEGERLDIVAHTQYDDSTKFWHVADANTQLEAETLTSNPGDLLLIPK